MKLRSFSETLLSLLPVRELLEGERGEGEGMREKEEQLLPRQQKKDTTVHNNVAISPLDNSQFLVKINRPVSTLVNGYHTDAAD